MKCFVIMLFSFFQCCSKNLISLKSVMYEKYRAKIALPVVCEVVALQKKFT